MCITNHWNRDVTYKYATLQRRFLDATNSQSSGRFKSRAWTDNQKIKFINMNKYILLAITAFYTYFLWITGITNYIQIIIHVEMECIVTHIADCTDTFCFRCSEHNERLRVQMSANKALSLYPKEKVEKTIEDFYAKVDRLNENEEKKRLLRSLERMFVQEAKVHQTLMDVAAPEAKRISAILNNLIASIRTVLKPLSRYFFRSNGDNSFWVSASASIRMAKLCTSAYGLFNKFFPLDYWNDWFVVPWCTSRAIQ